MRGLRNVCGVAATGGAAVSASTLAIDELLRRVCACGSKNCATVARARAVIDGFAAGIWALAAAEIRATSSPAELEAVLARWDARARGE